MHRGEAGLRNAAWEAMVIEEILRQLACLGRNADHRFYRTSAGTRVDLVLEADVLRIEVITTAKQGTKERRLRFGRRLVVGSGAWAIHGGITPGRGRVRNNGPP